MKSTFDLKSKGNIFYGLLGLLIFVALWETASRLGWIDPFFISSPTQVFKEAAFMFQTKSIYPHLLISLEEFLSGLILAIISGIILGMLIGWYKTLKSFTGLLLFGLYATPTIAIIPLIIIWFGLDIWPKVIIVFLSAFFPILINTISGIENTNINYIKLARSFGARDLQIFKTIALPASIPFIMAGLRLAIPRALIGMIVGEFYVSNKGLGYLITFYGSTFQTSKFLAAVLIVVIIGVTLASLVSLLENSIRYWKTQGD